MLHRCISLLVILGLFAGQLAAVPHAHAELSTEDRQEHDATPHIHCHWPGHDHHGHYDHGHGHSNGDQPRHHFGGVGPADRPADRSPQDGVSEFDHGASMICVPVTMTAVAAGRQVAQASTAQWWTAHAVLANIGPNLGKRGDSNGSWRPPDFLRDGSGIYLTLRQLRI